MWYPVKGTFSAALLLAWHPLCNNWVSVCMCVCPCTFRFISLILGQLEADMLSCSGITLSLREEGPKFGNGRILVVSTSRLSFWWLTCRSRRFCHDLRSIATHHTHATAKHAHSLLKSTSMVGSRILSTFRPFRCVSNDVLRIIWAFFTLMMLHKGNTCCIKQLFVSWLHSGCTVEIFEPDNVRFLLGVILDLPSLLQSDATDGQRHTAR